MTTFVRLSEDAQAYDLVMLLNRICSKQIQSMDEEKDKIEQAKEAEAEAKAKEEPVEIDLGELALKEAKDTKLGKLVEKSKLKQLMVEFFAATDKVFACSDDVIDAAFSLAMSLFVEVAAGNAKTEKEYVEKFCSIFIKDTVAKTALRLQLLAVLFNLLEGSSPLRHGVFVHIAQYALATKQSANLISHLSNLAAWKATWGLNQAQESQLQKLAFQLCEQRGFPEVAQSHLFEYLRLTKESSEKTAASAAKLARTVLAYDHNPEDGAVKPWFQFDTVLELPGVSALATSAEGEHKHLHALLQIFSTGTVADFAKFRKKSPAAISGLTEDANSPLSEDALLDKLRTLTLCSLGSEHERLSYALLMEELAVTTPDEVEEVVIAAVTTGKLEAKIDQEVEEIVIQRTTARVFKDEDWAAMSHKLIGWKDNVERVLTALHAVHANDGGAPEGHDHQEEEDADY